MYLRAAILSGKWIMKKRPWSWRMPSAVTRASNKLADLYGEVLIAAGRSDDARVYLEEKLVENPENTRTLELLALDAREAGEWDKAADYIERLLALNDEDRYLRNAAEIYSSLGDWEKTLSYMEKLFERNPGDGETVLLYLEALIRTDNGEEAERIAREALLVLEESEIRSSVYYNLYRVLPDMNDQLDTLRSALLENLHNLDALVLLSAGGCLFQGRRIPESLPVYKPGLHAGS